MVISVFLVTVSLKVNMGPTPMLDNNSVQFPQGIFLIAANI